MEYEYLDYAWAVAVHGPHSLWSPGRLCLINVKQGTMQKVELADPFRWLCIQGSPKALRSYGRGVMSSMLTR